MMTLCKHQKTVCPRHKGSFDCTPFCDICEAEQEYCPQCDSISVEIVSKMNAKDAREKSEKELKDALKIVLELLEQDNAHTLGHLLDWHFNGCEDKTKDEILYRTYLVAKNYLYSGNIEFLGRK